VFSSQTAADERNWTDIGKICKKISSILYFWV